MSAPGPEGPTRRIVLFSDTVADVNGVSRFVNDLARESRRRGAGLEVVTSTDLPMEPGENITNLRPRGAWAMPGYPMLRLVPPPVRRACWVLRSRRPSAVHISTPGPVGLAGLIAARRARLPILATYHTDFPAYVDHLWGDPSLTWLCREAMAAFYAPMVRIFTRSADYARRLRDLGVHCRRLTSLRPGTDTEAFHPRHRDAGVWTRLLGREAPAGVVRVLSVGRVSVEKNLPLLARVWPVAARRLAGEGVRAELIVVGDGPYRAGMARELAGSPARFLGFRFGEELASIYASSDLLVFPSATDTLGQVAMEAQSSGIPVMVSTRGGPREVVRDGRTGLVVAADDPGAWADAIVSLARDAARRRSMGGAARAHMEGFAFGRSFDHWWAAHERAIAEHALARAGGGRAAKEQPRPGTVAPTGEISR